MARRGFFWFSRTQIVLRRTVLRREEVERIQGQPAEMFADCVRVSTLFPSNEDNTAVCSKGPQQMVSRERIHKLSSMAFVSDPLRDCGFGTQTRSKIERSMV
jgi:hypothetical protein